MPSLSIEHLSKDFGGVKAVDDLSLEVSEGEMLVLVGPSGCGKTTSLRCLAGLERPTSGRIRIGERVVTAIEDGAFVPPEKREIGMVFQSYAVWPHMTVFENVAYPLRAIGVARDAIRDRVMAALELVHLKALSGRYSSQISGGQQQRVALARSLVAEPKLLLFDEPLSNLDASLRLQMRVEIKELQSRLGFTAVYVTHDQTEAMALANRIAIMDNGVLLQVGSPRAIYDSPANSFVAGFMGTTNLLKGKVRGSDARAACVGVGDGIEVEIQDPPRVAADEEVFVSIRPEELLVSEGPAPAGKANAWSGTVSLATFIGEQIIYLVDVGGHRLEVHTKPSESFELGSTVTVEANPQRCNLLRS